MASPAILRALSTTVAALTFATIILFLREKLALHPAFHRRLRLDKSIQLVSEEAPPSWDASQFVVQNPNADLHATLRANKYYITAWAEPTWTSTFVSQINSIYLGILTNRIPILPAFTPSDSDAPIPFSRVFDVERFWKERGIPLIDWSDAHSGSDLKCWSVSQATQREANPSGVHPNVSYTPVPEWTVFSNAPGFCKFSSLSRLSFAEGRRRAIGDASDGPDKHLMCFDSLLAVGEDDQWEWEIDYSPVWNLVGKYLHFKPDLIATASEYLHKVLGAGRNEDTPSFITVHVRANGTDVESPTISTLAHLVNGLALEIAMTSGVTITKILVFSDEVNPEWWQGVHAQGWLSIDHLAERTARRYGASFVPIIDAVIQSMSAGIVRTPGSTFGLMSQRRVQDWGEGPTRLVNYLP